MENPQREHVALTDEVYLGGWVPRLLPPSAVDIRTQHNIDTNEVWVRFKVGTPNFSPADLGYRPMEPANWPTQVRQPRHANWWFKSLSDFSPRDATLYVGTCQDASAGAPARSGHMLMVAGARRQCRCSSALGPHAHGCWSGLLLVRQRECGLTPRSTGPATASAVSLVRGTWCIIAYQAYGACLRRPVNSNVRPQIQDSAA